MTISSLLAGDPSPAGARLRRRGEEPANEQTYNGPGNGWCHRDVSQTQEFHPGQNRKDLAKVESDHCRQQETRELPQLSTEHAVEQQTANARK